MAHACMLTLVIEVVGIRAETTQPESADPQRSELTLSCCSISALYVRDQEREYATLCVADHIYPVPGCFHKLDDVLQQSGSLCAL